MGKIKKQVYTMDLYLNQMKEEYIRSDQDVQRLAGQWDKNMTNELLYTILTEDYMPAIILAEEVRHIANEVVRQMWILDGLQRSTTLMMFRYGNYKITSSIDNSSVSYQRNVTDDNGNVIRDDEGNIVKETVVFDIKNKTYEQLPSELKKRFNAYQIDTVIHEECTMESMSKFVKRYNNHKAMTTNQKALSYIDKYARTIRSMISNCEFFRENTAITEKERKNGTLEKIVMEFVMGINHFDHWTKEMRKIGTFLNNNSNLEEFGKVEGYLNRIAGCIKDEDYKYFTSKNALIWVMLFDKFTQMNLDDTNFADFLSAFDTSLHNEKVEVSGEYVIESGSDERTNVLSWRQLDSVKSTKDKGIIVDKLTVLEKLMNDFLKSAKANESTISSVKSDSKNADFKPFDDHVINEYVTFFLKSDLVNGLEVKGKKNDIQKVAIQSLFKCGITDSSMMTQDNIDDVKQYMDDLNEWSLRLENSQLTLEKIPEWLLFIKNTYKYETDEDVIEQFINNTNLASTDGMNGLFPMSA